MKETAVASKPTRISDLFESARRKGRKILSPYFVAGFPDMGSSGELILEALHNGADMVEIGLPFSDPLADGPVIQYASQAALHNGMNVSRLFKLVRGLRKQFDAPFVVMTYVNLILQYGLSAFLRDANAAGVDGLVVPDLTWEAGRRYHAAFREGSIDLIPLIAPTSPPARIRRIAEDAQGFVYLVSVTGVTGERKELPPGLKDFVGRVRKATEKPICVGFGISTPEQAREVTRIADGAIVGSALVQRIASAADTNTARSEVRMVIAAMRAEIDRA
ncbi:MAG: tryptophan synthase subunit alpha [Planctomycetota bacterium]